MDMDKLTEYINGEDRENRDENRNKDESNQSNLICSQEYMDNITGNVHVLINVLDDVGFYDESDKLLETLNFVKESKSVREFEKNIAVLCGLIDMDQVIVSQKLSGIIPNLAYRRMARKSYVDHDRQRMGRPAEINADMINGMHKNFNRFNNFRNRHKTLNAIEDEMEYEWDDDDYTACEVEYDDGNYYFKPVTSSECVLDAREIDLESPKDIVKYLNAYVLGQNAAKKMASTAYYLHTVKDIKQSLLFIGPSGCGKTEIFRRLSELAPRKVYIYDSSSITNDGWKGMKKYYSVFLQMLSEGWTLREIEHAIIVFDEADKMFAPRYSSGNENVSFSVQSEFLAMIEGTRLRIDSDKKCVNINTKNISFMFLGAFDEIRKEKKQQAGHAFGFNGVEEPASEITFEDIIKFGLRSEFAGRISRIATLNALTENDFYTILKDGIISPFSKFAIDYKGTIRVSEAYLKELACKAVENDMGVRFMHGQAMDLLSEEIFEPGSMSDVSIDEDEPEC